MLIIIWVLNCLFFFFLLYWFWKYVWIVNIFGLNFLEYFGIFLEYLLFFDFLMIIFWVRSLIFVFVFICFLVMFCIIEMCLYLIEGVMFRVCLLLDMLVIVNFLFCVGFWFVEVRIIWLLIFYVIVCFKISWLLFWDKRIKYWLCNEILNCM